MPLQPSLTVRATATPSLSPSPSSASATPTPTPSLSTASDTAPLHALVFQPQQAAKAEDQLAQLNAPSPSLLSLSPSFSADGRLQHELQRAVGKERWESRRRSPTTDGEEEQGRAANTRSGRLGKRQELPVGADGYPSCNLVSNGVLSCFPTANTTLVQGEWSKFVWNANFPGFIGAGYIDIHLFRADSETLALSFLGIENSRRTIAIRPSDEWWPVNQTSWTEGRNETWPFFFVVVEGNRTLDGGETHQSTFRAVQTAAPATLIASLSSSSASSASSASLASASLSSLSSLSAASISIQSASSRANAALQSGSPSSDSNSSGGGLPKWAIAVIVVLSVLAFLGLAVGSYFCMKLARRRRTRSEGDGAGMGGGRGGGGPGTDGASSAMGSEKPMMSSTTAGLPLALGTAARQSDAASRRPLSSTSGDTSEGPITHTDAAIMAEAFRKALRKPEFPSGDTTPSPGAEALARAETGEVGEYGSDEGEYFGGGGGGRRESAILGGGGGGQGGELAEREIRMEGRSLSTVQGGGGRRWGEQG